MLQKQILVPKHLALLLQKKKEVKNKGAKIIIIAPDQKKLRQIINDVEQTKTIYNKIRRLLHE